MCFDSFLIIKANKLNAAILSDKGSEHIRINKHETQAKKINPISKTKIN